MRWVIEDVHVRTQDMALPLDVPWIKAQQLYGHSELMRPEVGCVYGVLHNDPAALEALGEKAHEAPYKAPPKAVVLYSKPRNTWCATAQSIVPPAGVSTLQVGAALGIVMGEVATRLSVVEALEYVAGYTVVNDLSVPHDSFYRPSMRFKTCDASCVIGPWVRSSSHVPNPDDLTVSVRVDGVEMQRYSTGIFARHAAQLLSDVTAFMTLQPNDVLLLGVAHPAVYAHVGQNIEIDIEQVGRISNRIMGVA